MSIPLNFRNLVIVALVLMCVGAYIFTIKLKDKDSFEKISGKIIYLDDSYQELPHRQKDKYRYLSIDTYQYIIEIFIGKDFGDFAPKFEKIDKLNIGDSITVYYEESSKIYKTGVNRSVEFIDKGAENYYEDGNRTFYVGGFIIVVSFSLIPFGYYLKKKGKIE